MAFAILRTEKIKDVEKLTGVAAHHYRTRTVKNADGARTANNIHLVDSSHGLINTVQDRIGNRKIRKNGVVAIEVLMTASPEYFRDDPTEYGVYEQNKVNHFNSRAIEFLKAEFGTQNVVSAICHLDEATPHIHAVVVPIDPDSDRLNASRWLDGKLKLSALQDRYFEYMKPLGLERGLKGSEAEHTTIKQYYGVLQNTESVSMPSPVVTPPPLMAKPSSRESWAASESGRLQQQQRPYFSIIEAQAAISVINRDKAQQAQKTAQKLAGELEQARAAAKKAKDIELTRLLVQMRAKRIEQGSGYHVSGQSILIDGQSFTDNQQQISGTGSIDLLMHLERFDYQEALCWIGQQFGQSAAIGAAMTKARYDAENAGQEIIKLPVPEVMLWSSVRDYLIVERNLAPPVIDWLYDRERIFATSMRGEVCACFAFRRNHKTVGVELMGAGSRSFHGFRGDQSGGFHIKTRNPDGLILVDSALEAISLRALKNCSQLSEYKAFDVMAVFGGDVANSVQLARMYRQVVLASWHDDEEKLANMQAWMPHAVRLMPDSDYVCWSDYLKSNSHEQAVRSVKSHQKNPNTTLIKY